MRTCLLLGLAAVVGLVPACAHDRSWVQTEMEGRTLDLSRDGRSVEAVANTAEGANETIVVDWTVVRDGKTVHTKSDRAENRIRARLSGFRLSSGDEVHAVARYLDAEGHETARQELGTTIP